MKALVEHFVSYLVAVGCGVVVGPFLGWRLFWLKPRWPYIVGGLTGAFVIAPVVGVPGVLEVLVVIALLIAFIMCAFVAVVSRQISRFQGMLDALAARGRESGSQG
jgi:hypothetical protein